jgi:hypothetical protein
MDVIADSTETSKLGAIAEIKQVTVSADTEIGAVNDLLGQGWKLLHIGQGADRTVYVLGRSSEQSRRRPGFLA